MATRGVLSGDRDPAPRAQAQYPEIYSDGERAGCMENSASLSEEIHRIPETWPSEN